MNKQIASVARLNKETDLFFFLERRINAPLIEKLLSVIGKSWEDDISLKECSFISGNDSVYRLCCLVQTSLGLKDHKIEYLTSSDLEINAASLFRTKNPADNRYVVILNLDLLHVLNKQELSYVIGHEIGHLLFAHTRFKEVVQFIYPQLERMPYLLKNKYELWSQLAEMSADRIGLMAAGEVEPAVKAMYKCSHGFKTRSRRNGYKNLMSAADSSLEGLSATSFQPFRTHPLDAFRVKALKLFSESKTWANYMKGRPLKKDKDLNDGMEELISLLKRSPAYDIDEAELEFLASAGYLIIAADRDVERDEVDYLKNLLSRYLYLPRGFVRSLKKKDLKLILRRSSQYILENRPKRTKELFMALLPLIMRDEKIDDREVDLGLKIAVEYLRIDKSKAVDLMLGAIRDLYAPFS